MKVKDTLYSIKKDSNGITTYLIAGSTKEYKSLDDNVSGDKEAPKSKK